STSPAPPDPSAARSSAAEAFASAADPFTADGVEKARERGTPRAFFSSRVHRAARHKERPRRIAPPGPGRLDDRAGSEGAEQRSQVAHDAVAGAAQGGAGAVTRLQVAAEVEAQTNLEGVDRQVEVLDLRALITGEDAVGLGGELVFGAGAGGPAVRAARAAQVEVGVGRADVQTQGGGGVEGRVA